MPTPSLKASMSVVQPGDDIILTCSRTPNTCATRELQMYKNGAAVSAGVQQDSVVLRLSISSSRDQANYSCGYPEGVANAPVSSTIQITVAANLLKTPFSSIPWLLYLLVAGGLVLLLLSIFLVWRCCLGNRRKKGSRAADNVLYKAQSYRRSEDSAEALKDDERDYESVDDEDEGDYVNTETLGGREQSSAEEEDYVNTETLGGWRTINC
ncbi:allergin-1-like isoform X2 [Sardina pilchardus]